MPAKAKVTKEMIVDTAFAIAREAGAENINARTVSERLSANCFSDERSGELRFAECRKRHWQNTRLRFVGSTDLPKIAERNKRQSIQWQRSAHFFI